MKKQTAVDQLREKLLKEFGFVYSDNIHEEIKLIEKKQTEKAFKDGIDQGFYIGGGSK
jgi:hypothetical protein